MTSQFRFLWHACIYRISHNGSSNPTYWSLVHFVTPNCPTGFVFEAKEFSNNAAFDASAVLHYGCLGNTVPNSLLDGCCGESFSPEHLHDFKYCPEGNKAIVEYSEKGSFFCRARVVEHDQLRSRYNSCDVMSCDVLTVLFLVTGPLIAFVFLELEVNRLGTDPDVDGGTLAGSYIISFGLAIATLVLALWAQLLVHRREFEMTILLAANPVASSSDDDSSQSMKESRAETKARVKANKRAKQKAMLAKMEFGADLDDEEASLSDTSSMSQSSSSSDEPQPRGRKRTKMSKAAKKRTTKKTLAKMRVSISSDDSSDAPEYESTQSSSS
jgi:hypothetical protein